MIIKQKYLYSHACQCAIEQLDTYSQIILDFVIKLHTPDMRNRHMVILN